MHPTMGNNLFFPLSFKILIVDEDPAFCRGIAELVASEPEFIVCGEAADTRDALAAIRREIPDLVILDISLKDGDFAGLDLISEINALSGSISILIYSMHDEMRFALKTLQIGARGYLMKQCPIRHVVTALRNLLENGFYVSEQVIRQLLYKHMKPGNSDASASFFDDSVSTLSNREMAVFKQLSKGLPPREIASELNISVKTVEAHRIKISSKLGLSSLSALTRFAVDWNRGQ